MNDTHLTQEERSQIYALFREGLSKRHIALRLKRDQLKIDLIN